MPDRGRHQARKRAVDLLFEAEARGLTPAEVAEVLRAVLEHCGYRVSIATDDCEAGSILLKGCIDLLVADVARAFAQVPDPAGLAQRALAGAHPGFRPVHAKGIVCSGTFRGASDASRVSRALHLQGQAIPTIVRFANANGNPEVHDGLANVRSMAVKFQLPDGKNADILALHIEGFPARTPEEFLAFLRAQLPDTATGKPARPAPGFARRGL